MKTDCLFLDRLAEHFAVSESPTSRVSLGELHISAQNKEDLRHELLHIALGHWRCCGESVNLAADLSLCIFLRSKVSGYPAELTLEAYSRLIGGGVRSVKFGVFSSNPLSHILRTTAAKCRNELQQVLDRRRKLQLSDKLTFIHTLPEMARLGIKRSLALFATLEDELKAAAFRSANDRIILPPFGNFFGLLSKQDKAIALDAAAHSYGLREIELDTRPTLIGSSKRKTAQERRVVSGVLLDVLLKDCDVEADTIIRCKLVKSRVRCRQAINCSLDSTSTLEAENVTCNQRSSQ